MIGFRTYLYSLKQPLFAGGKDNTFSRCHESEVGKSVRQAINLELPKLTNKFQQRYQVRSGHFSLVHPYMPNTTKSHAHTQHTYMNIYIHAKPTKES